MKNILFISQYLNVAGTETFMMNVARTITKSQFHVDFLVFSDTESEYSREAERLGCQVYRLPSRRSGLVYYIGLNKFFKAKQGFYDAIHFCGGSMSSIAPIFYAYKYGVKVRIVHSHNSYCDGFHNKILHGINRLWVNRFLTHRFACSSLAATFFFQRKPCRIINNGIHLDGYLYDEKARKQFREQYGISSTTQLIGNIGRFEPVKNHSFILKIFQSYLSTHPDSMLVLVGVGSLWEVTRNLAQEMGFGNRVLFLGERNDIPGILSALDCFLMPSLYEGLPFVLVEAQASGLPCVVSNTMNRDVKLTDNFTFVPLDSEMNAWVDALSTSMQQIRDRQLVGAGLRELGFDIDSSVKYLEGVYAGVD